MNFLTQSLTFLLGIASFASTANADCTTDFNSDAYQTFMEGYYDDDSVDIPALCIGVGGDLFAFSGTTTCGDQDQVLQHSNNPMCLPTSCTSNEADIALKIPMIMYEGESCTGSYTYDGLGDGHVGYSFFSCRKEEEEEKTPIWRWIVLELLVLGCISGCIWGEGGRGCNLGGCPFDLN